jgi:hypothetical protein
MLEAMEHGAAMSDPWVMNTPLADKFFDPVRGSPWFAKIVRQLGVDPARYTSEALGRTR